MGRCHVSPCAPPNASTRSLSARSDQTPPASSPGRPLASCTKGGGAANRITRGGIFHPAPPIASTEEGYFIIS
eukprot:9601-Prorocentrum_minimum.AAC.1